MDAGLLVISALLLVTAGAAPWNNTAENNTSTESPVSKRPSVTDFKPPAPYPTYPPPIGFLTVKWIKQCEGNVHVVPGFPFTDYSYPVCYSQWRYAEKISEDLCQHKKGCNDTLKFDKGDRMDGIHLENRFRTASPCNILTIKCKVEIPPDDEWILRQLHTYKVMTALLSCVLLLLLLIRFTRPTVKALQKKLSDKRQNRWIGPTQSHSVSYHRGKTAVVNNDGENRLSYPALERLVVSNSREPSSNRNSGFSF